MAIARPGPVGTNRRLLYPFDLQVWAVDRMLNFEIIDDPIYEGLELQVSDDPAHGTGMIVLLKRRQDGRFDIYRQPGLTLDPELAQVGGQSSSGQSRCRCSSWAAATWSAVAAGSSRSASTTTRSRPGACLGPGCTAAGWTSTPPPTPPWWWSTGPTTDPAARRHTGPWRGRGSLGVPGIASLRAGSGEHAANLGLEPAVPDLTSLASGVRVRGVWRLGVDDDPTVVGGTWTARRSGDRVDLVLDVTRGWRPKGLPLLMAAVTRVAPSFRRWPTTDRWTATVTLGNEPTLRSRWDRKGDRRDESDRRLTA